MAKPDSTMSVTATPAEHPRIYRQQSAGVKGIGYLIFFSRWLQAPLYLGLIVAQLIYVVVFVIELVHLAETVMHDPLKIDEAKIMLAVLGLIDVVMIANQLIMVIIGGYETFVSRIDIDGHPDQPRVALARERERAQGEAGDGHHRYLVDPPAQDIHRGGRHRLTRV